MLVGVRGIDQLERPVLFRGHAVNLPFLVSRYAAHDPCDLQSFRRRHGAVKARYKIGEISAGTIIREEGQQPRVRIHSSIYENEHLLKNDPNYLPTLEAISDPNRKKAWLLGDWDIHVGSFLEGVWDASKHIGRSFSHPVVMDGLESDGLGLFGPVCRVLVCDGL